MKIYPNYRVSCKRADTVCGYNFFFFEGLDHLRSIRQMNDSLAQIRAVKIAPLHLCSREGNTKTHKEEEGREGGREGKRGCASMTTHDISFGILHKGVSIYHAKVFCTVNHEILPI